MKAIAIATGTTGARLIERPKPAMTAPTQVMMRVLRVGICGTDREEAAGGRAEPPPGATELVLGHEMIGKVVEVGAGVRSVRPGDYGVFTVRRGCDHCPACAAQRYDLCFSGDYTERGIKQADGYQTEFVVDDEAYLVPVPATLGVLGVLTEPMSVAEKAIDEALRVQEARLTSAISSVSDLSGRRTLVAGLGPIGLLAAVALRLRGAEVIGLDIVDPNSVRPSLLATIGGTYVDGRQVTTDALDDRLGNVDMIVEATGVASLEFGLIDALGPNGVYVLTGIPSGDRPFCVSGAELIRQLVLNNQMMIGSVNASREHFAMAIVDLEEAQRRWRGLLDQIITHKFTPEDFEKPLSEHADDAIKSVIEWGAP
jgi:glucose 1-dehydrogenase